MAGIPAQRIGRGPCPHCAEPVTFKKSSGGKLTFSCDACFATGYAEPGGPTFAAWSKTIRPFESDPAPARPAPAAADPVPAPAAADPVPAPAAADPVPAPPAARKRSNVFSLVDL
jgi:hypothetical protein